MANENAEIKDLLYVRKIIANKAKDPETGEEQLWPEGYEDSTIKDGSLWFIQEDS